MYVHEPPDSFCLIPNKYKTEADILWTAAAAATSPPPPTTTTPQWRGALPNLVEAVDDKCGMARLLRGAPWLPRTFCLPEELPALLRCWEEETEEEEERLWILKPPHLARGWDIALAAELPCVLRHLQVTHRTRSDHPSSPP